MNKEFGVVEKNNITSFEEQEQQQLFLHVKRNYVTVLLGHPCLHH